MKIVPLEVHDCFSPTKIKSFYASSAQCILFAQYNYYHLEIQIILQKSSTTLIIFKCALHLQQSIISKCGSASLIWEQHERSFDN